MEDVPADCGRQRPHAQGAFIAAQKLTAGGGAEGGSLPLLAQPAAHDGPDRRQRGQGGTLSEAAREARTAQGGPGGQGAAAARGQGDAARRHDSCGLDASRQRACALHEGQPGGQADRGARQAKGRATHRPREYCGPTQRRGCAAYQRGPWHSACKRSCLQPSTCRLTRRVRAAQSRHTQSFTLVSIGARDRVRMRVPHSICQRPGIGTRIPWQRRDGCFAVAHGQSLPIFCCLLSPAARTRSSNLLVRLPTPHGWE
eukprot:scaffold137824_cov30-Tisochrysis_lutea.AAC.1